MVRKGTGKRELIRYRRELAISLTLVLHAALTLSRHENVILDR